MQETNGWEHVEDVSDKATGKAHHIRLSDPVEVRELLGDGVKCETADFIVSATIAPLGGPETYAFPADESGEVESWGEVIGVSGQVSRKGTLDWEAVADDLAREANGDGIKA